MSIVGYGKRAFDEFSSRGLDEVVAGLRPSPNYSYDTVMVLQRVWAGSIDRYLKPAKAGDEVEAEPGFFEGDMAGHCGPTFKDEIAGTREIPFEVTGLDFDNGSGYLNHAVIAWAADLRVLNRLRRLANDRFNYLTLFSRAI